MDIKSPQNEYDQIAKICSIATRQKVHPDVYRKLSDSVAYAYGMGVPGDFVEFGTMTGRTAVALASSISTCHSLWLNNDNRHGFKGQHRKLWLFDSFEGLPESHNTVDNSSLHVQKGVWGKATCKGLSKEALEDLLKNYIQASQFHVVKGWFKDTVTFIPDETRFSLVHVDGDLYSSAIDSLDNLFSRGLISEGARILFDDFDCNASMPSMGERRAWTEIAAKYLIRYTDMGPYGLCGHYFTVHDYDSASK